MSNYPDKCSSVKLVQIGNEGEGPIGAIASIKLRYIAHGRHL